MMNKDFINKFHKIHKRNFVNFIAFVNKFLIHHRLTLSLCQKCDIHISNDKKKKPDIFGSTFLPQVTHKLRLNVSGCDLSKYHFFFYLFIW